MNSNPMTLSRRQAIRQTARAIAGIGLGWVAATTGHTAGVAGEQKSTPSGTGRSGLPGAGPGNTLDLPDPEITLACEKAATQNVLAAVDATVFPGYWSVCADREGFGKGNTYPSLDGHQLADALLWLGQEDVVKANWDYVRSFQKPNGHLPIAILPGMKEVSGQAVEANGGLYKHWVPGDPLRALGGTTFIQNADILFRRTQDRGWLRAQLPSVNLAAEFLASLTTPEGLVGGAGYYVEFPTRIEFDGVTQCHAVDAFRRAAALNRVLGEVQAARRYEAHATRIARTFLRRYWVGDHFAEYIHPQRGVIDRHGLTDTNWAALATGVASARQRKALWPRLRSETGFHYGGVPTGIAARPDSYEDWEFSLPNHRHDLASMGRVWYLESWARARQGDGEGALDALRRVASLGRANGYFWRERYHPPAGQPAGPNTYCEYPANFIRIVQRFLLGLEFQLDGSLTIAPVVPSSYWSRGFGHSVTWRDRTLAFRFDRNGISGSYTGASPQRVAVRLEGGNTDVRSTFRGASCRPLVRDGSVVMELPSSPEPSAFVVWRKNRA